jgi:hypothetical protein
VKQARELSGGNGTPGRNGQRAAENRAFPTNTVVQVDEPNQKRRQRGGSFPGAQLGVFDAVRGRIADGAPRVPSRAFRAFVPHPKRTR